MYTHFFLLSFILFSLASFAHSPPIFFLFLALYIYIFFLYWYIYIYALSFIFWIPSSSNHSVTQCRYIDSARTKLPLFLYTCRLYVYIALFPLLLPSSDPFEEWQTCRLAIKRFLEFLFSISILPLSFAFLLFRLLFFHTSSYRSFSVCCPRLMHLFVFYTKAPAREQKRRDWNAGSERYSIMYRNKCKYSIYVYKSASDWHCFGWGARARRTFILLVLKWRHSFLFNEMEFNLINEIHRHCSWGEKMNAWFNYSKVCPMYNRLG